MEEEITAYIERRAAEHDEKSKNPTKTGHASYHRGTAVLFRALASDIKAGLYRA